MAPRYAPRTVIVERLTVIVERFEEVAVFNDILVGVDGRQGGRDAIALASKLAALGASLALVHVYAPVWTWGPGSETDPEHDEGDRLLRSERDAAGITAELVVCANSSPARGLHELAEQRGSDLIVVGSDRQALLGRVLLGDMARATFNGAPCAIAVAPRGYTQAGSTLHRIGVGYDGSPESRAALMAARELAGRHGAKVTALWVVALQDVREERPIPADWTKTAEVLVTRSLDELRQIEGIEADAVYGDPREELSRMSGQVDLLIVGARGYGPLGRLVHGSVSSHLFGHVSCPLLVLPRSAVRKGQVSALATEAQPAPQISV
jgi:nucleotide-binding universal stress UspA family protein